MRRTPAVSVLVVATVGALLSGVLAPASAAVTARTALPAAAVATVPSAPTSAKATRDDATASATLTWQPPTSTGGSAITGYRVGRDGTDSAGQGPWSGPVSATTTSFRFTRLVPGTTYVLSVQAVNAMGRSVAASVPVVLGVPAAPTAVAATKSDSAKTATVTWGAPTSTGGAAITGYRVSRDGTDSTGKGPYTATVAATVRSLTFTSLVAGRTYALTVVAVNARGAGDPATRSVTMASAPSAPGAVVASSGTSTTGTLSWTAPTSTGGSAITGYRVGRDGTDSTGKGPWSGPVATTVRTFTFTNLVPGRTYALSVSAVNAAGTGTTVTRSVYVVPMAAPGDHLLRKTQVTVDPSGTSMVLRLADGSLRRFALGAGDTYQDLMTYERTGPLTRAVFAGRVPGVRDYVRLNYRTLPSAASVFRFSDPAPYPAKTGEYWEHREDYGVAVTVDPTGTFLVLHGQGEDPVTGEERYGDLLTRFELRDASSYSYTLRDFATDTHTVHPDISRSEFVRLMATHEYEREITFTYDAVTGTGSFHVTGQVNEPVPVV